MPSFFLSGCCPKCFFFFIDWPFLMVGLDFIPVSALLETEGKHEACQNHSETSSWDGDLTMQMPFARVLAAPMHAESQTCIQNAHPRKKNLLGPRPDCDDHLSFPLLSALRIFTSQSPHLSSKIRQSIPPAPQTSKLLISLSFQKQKHLFQLFCQ